MGNEGNIGKIRKRATERTLEEERSIGKIRNQRSADKKDVWMQKMKMKRGWESTDKEETLERYPLPHTTLARCFLYIYYYTSTIF